MSDNDDIEVDSDVSMETFRFFSFFFFFKKKNVILLTVDLAPLANQLALATRLVLLF